MDELERLRQENAALREALQNEWDGNHFEQCGGEWPHPGRRCLYPPLDTPTR